MARLSSAPVRLLLTVVFAGLVVGAISPGAATAAPAAVRVTPAGVRAQLGPLINIPQTWNNCGPTSVAEVLAYYGISRSQDQVKAVLRGDGNPYGMAPYGVPAYMRSLGMRALLGIDGSDRVLKALIANGFPVIVSQWVSLADHVGHYRPLQAFDDAQGMFVSSDPYLGQGHIIAYAEFDAIWQTTNRRFMVLYPPRRAELLQAVLKAAGWDYTRAYRQDLAHQQALIAGKAPDRTGYGSHRNYYLALAWDELQLHQIAAARADLRRATLAGANSVTTGWVADEITLAAARR